MQDFAAIDFETANNERSSVCSVGVVIVRGGEIVDKSLVMHIALMKAAIYVMDIVCELFMQK